MNDDLAISLITLGSLVALFTIGVLVQVGAPWTYERRLQEAKDRRDAEWLTQVDEWNRSDRAHTHGAWCHPSADGCPDRPGM